MNIVDQMNRLCPQGMQIYYLFFCFKIRISGNGNIDANARWKYIIYVFLFRIQISSKGIIETNARSVLDCFPVKCQHQELENSFDDFIATPSKAWNYVKKHG